MRGAIGRNPAFDPEQGERRKRVSGVPDVISSEHAHP